MKILDLTFSSPADNLACDEALLDECEASGTDEVLRFWQAEKYFVVLGYSNHWKEELMTDARVPVFRRCSGGGTVLQGPGCLNYSLILKIKRGGGFDNIRSTNDFVMQRHRRTLSDLLGQEVLVQGHTDLTLGSLKFSGNSQRRKRNRLLFHGTFLLNFAIGRIGRCLKIPVKQPAYRQDRTHSSFVTNIDVTAEKMKQALAKTWGAGTKLENIPGQRIKELTRERYSKKEWNLKF